MPVNTCYDTVQFGNVTQDGEDVNLPEKTVP
jgi:hypothetical protein